jgi:hypothetical protein
MSLLALAAIVTVEGDTTCPAPARVTEQLELLLASGDSRDAPDRARISATGEGLALELDSASGRTLARREFSRQASCEQLATAIAVVIATWESSAQGVAPTLSIDAPEPPTPPMPARPTTIVTGAGLATVIDRGGWAPAVTAELVVGSRWAAVLDIIATRSNSAALAPGSASWARHRIALGGRVTAASYGAFALDASGQVVAGLLVAAGSGFSADQTAASFDPGVAVGVRARLVENGWSLFAAANETAWLRANHLAVTGLSQLDAPRHDLVMSLGLAVQLR